MRISDWISDVCSSDLQSGTVGTNVSPAVGYETLFVDGAVRRRGDFYPGDYDGNANLQPVWRSKEGGINAPFETEDRQGVVSGKSVSVRGDLGGRRISKKKKNETGNTTAISETA